MNKEEFQNFIKTSWNNHADDPIATGNIIQKNVIHISEASQIAPYVKLSLHVLGEHLSEYQRCIDLYQQLLAQNINQYSETEIFTIYQAITILKMAHDQNVDLEAYSKEAITYIYSQVALLFAGQKKFEKSELFFKKALAEISGSINSIDPIFRTMAITGNNLACSLEEQKQRTLEQNTFMILAAQSALKFWTLAGTWLEIERSEYRLAKTFLCAENKEQALIHAKNCFKISLENKAPALELFFATEVLILTHQACLLTEELKSLSEKIVYFYNELNVEDQKWCLDVLKSLNLNKS